MRHKAVLVTLAILGAIAVMFGWGFYRNSRITARYEGVSVGASEGQVRRILGTPSWVEPCGKSFGRRKPNCTEYIYRNSLLTRFMSRRLRRRFLEALPHPKVTTRKDTFVFVSAAYEATVPVSSPVGRDARLKCAECYCGDLLFTRASGAMDLFTCVECPKALLSDPVGILVVAI
jgi:hypothetical protein